MKKLLVSFVICFIFALPVFAQTNNTVDITDDVYSVLQSAELRGLCGPLSNVRPYTQQYILKTIDTIIENLEDSDYKYKDNEIEQLEFYKNRFVYEEGLDYAKLLYRTESEKGGVPITFNYNLSEENFVSSGFYSDSDNNSTGYELWGNMNLFGDLGKNLSWKTNAYVEVTKMPMEKLGTYHIGLWWDYEENHTLRTINTYRNYSVLPFSYKKHWDGSVYYLHGGVNAAGLKGWPFESAFGFGMQGEIHASLWDGLLELAAGRINREWGAMDQGSSLIFNANAHPMFAVEAKANLFDWMSFSTLTGFLEFPNQDYIVKNAWYTTYDVETPGNPSDPIPDTPAETDITKNSDSFYFHNIFAIAMLDLDWEYVHWDFGSTVVLPNRFELGYSFPLVDRVVYQNNVGDYDNLALFTNLKLRYPGIGYIWGSFYLEEMNAISARLFENTRCMFAYQGGAKAAIPFLPFSYLSLRYTKVEPFCYTHTALSPTEMQPYFGHYISESYTNNGESLGYYLPPNSDELFVQFKTRPFNGLSFNFGYQLIRHGVDWGSKSSWYSGSSIYSELPTTRDDCTSRGDLRKKFLHDGTYEWFNIFNFTAAYDFRTQSLPIQLYMNFGYVHNWFTTIGAAQGPQDTPYTEIKNNKYKKFSDDEYKEGRGCVLSVGIKLFAL